MNREGLTYLTITSILILLAGILVTIVVPALESPPPAQGSRPPYTEQELRGKMIYQREGCWYCHTQQVRRPEVGVGTILIQGDIGPESKPEDYVHDQPVLWGTERQGPDLAHVASRPYGAVKEWHIAHLKDPQLISPGSVMPSFAHLPEDELEALADYLLTLK
jgi:cbb3-type cytochrome c oxidase subunit II